MKDRQNILIVDDIPENLRVLGTLLEEDYDVSIATNGPDALELVKSSTPDLILLDIIMPGMNGYEVCRKLKSNLDYKTIPVIFLSANGETEQKINAFLEGAVDYITKPFNIDEVLARVRTHLQLRQSEERFRRAVTEAPFPIMISADDGEVLTLSRTWTEFSGYDHTDIKTFDLWNENAFGMSKQSGVQENLQNIEHRNGEGEHVITCKNGSKRIWDFSSASLGRLPDGRLMEMRMASDITKRKRAEEELKKSEFFFKESQRSAFIGSYEIDFTTGFWETSEVLDQIFGIDQNYNKSVQGWLEIVYPGDREMIDRYLREEVIQKRQAFKKEYRIKRKSDSEIRWVYGIGKVKFDVEGNLISMIGTTQDITERKLAEQEILNSKEQLRLLSGRLQEIREEERTRIAMEVHDDLGQALSGLKLDLMWLNKRVTTQGYSTEKVQTDISAILNSIDTIISAVRRISTELRPGVLDFLGLKTSFEWQAKEFEKKTEIKCKCRIEIEDFEISPEKTVSLFRILQESLTNIIRHSKASEVLISLDQDEENITMKVTDNGIGISEQSITDYKSLGLLGMRERALFLDGTFKIYRMINGGTVVLVSVPKDKKETE